MNFDAVIIGAGVIGAALALELSKAGFKTLNVDKNHDAGMGSTSGSCAIVRVHYSTLDGSALAYEGYFDWKNWSDYLGVEDTLGNATLTNLSMNSYILFFLRVTFTPIGIPSLNLKLALAFFDLVTTGF